MAMVVRMIKPVDQAGNTSLPPSSTTTSAMTE
jgi:hypothetical protein